VTIHLGITRPKRGTKRMVKRQNYEEGEKKMKKAALLQFL
jgi:hypothetical protein